MKELTKKTWLKPKMEELSSTETLSSAAAAAMQDAGVFPNDYAS